MEEEKRTIGAFTRAFLTKQGTLKVILPGCPYEAEPDEVQVNGIVQIGINISTENVISADVKLWADKENPPLNTTYAPRFLMYDPISGDVKELTKVEFRDGSFWEAPRRL